IGARARPASGVVDGGLVVADAFLLGAIEVGGGGNAGLERGVVQGAGERRLPAVVLHLERPADAVELIAAALVILGFLEVREDGVVVPAVAAALAPLVIVGGVAAHIDHAVDRRGAA